MGDPTPAIAGLGVTEQGKAAADAGIDLRRSTSFPAADPDADLYGARVKVAFELLGDGDAAEAIPYFAVV